MTARLNSTPHRHRPQRLCSAMVLMVSCTIVSVVAAETTESATGEAAGLGPTFPNPLEARSRYGLETRYVIKRNGKLIGEHRVRFDDVVSIDNGNGNGNGNGNDDFRVIIESDIDVRVLGLSVYRLHYESIETWREGSLVRVVSRTDDDGQITSTELQRQSGQIIAVQSDGTSQVLPSMLLPSNHWYVAVVNETALFNTITGDISRVDIEPAGNLSFDSPGNTLQATRYRYSGDLELQAWYDASGLWYGMEFTGEDGSLIRYELEPQPQPQP